MSTHYYTKLLGETPLAALNRFKEEFPEYADQPMTYAGRLDPMAQGLMLFLSGEDLQNKNAFLGLEKTYQARILLGIETDSLDVLGLVKYVRSTVMPVDPHQLLRNFEGRLNLPVPVYSAFPVNGKPLFSYVQKGLIDSIEVPLRTMEVYECVLNQVSWISASDILAYAESTLPLVQGDFRQTDILKSWKRSLDGVDYSFPVLTVTFRVSGGTYIRSIAKAIGDAHGYGGLLLSLRRVKIGDVEL